MINTGRNQHLLMPESLTESFMKLILKKWSKRYNLAIKQMCNRYIEDGV